MKGIGQENKAIYQITKYFWNNLDSLRLGLNLLNSDTDFPIQLELFHIKNEVKVKLNRHWHGPWTTTRQTWKLPYTCEIYLLFSFPNMNLW